MLTYRRAVQLLEQLNTKDPEQATLIGDIYSEVFHQMQEDAVKDAEMVRWLEEALAGGLDANYRH